MTTEISRRALLAGAGVSTTMLTGDNQRKPADRLADLLAEGGACATVPADGFAELAANVRDFGARGDGQGDDSGAFARALAAAAGRLIWVPPGTYRIGRTVDARVAAPSTLTPGPRIIGAGIESTTLVNAVSGAPMLRLGPDSDARAGFKGVQDVLIAGMTIQGDGRATGQTAIELRACYASGLKRIHIVYMAGTGVRVPCTSGDNDACNGLTLEQVRIENCSGWGLDMGDPGHNEISFTRLDRVIIQNCGTEAAGLPQSGGMKWVGQVLDVHGCAFTLNRNVGAYIPGQPGMASNVRIISTAFENNRGRHILSTGVKNLVVHDSQLYNNDSEVAGVGIDLDFRRFPGANIDIRRIKVRATPGNDRYTAFRLAGGEAQRQTCRVRDTDWDNFDYRGQVRFDGWTFDAVERHCQFVPETGQVATLRPWNGSGGDMPLRLRKAVHGDTPSATGEWIRYRVPNGGVSVTNKELLPDRAYHAYLFDPANNVARPAAIELSETPPEVDLDSGYQVKRGDPTRLHVGGVTTGPDGRFRLTGNGFLNARRVPGGQVWSYLWEDARGRLRRNVERPGSDEDGTLAAG